MLALVLALAGADASAFSGGAGTCLVGGVSVHPPATFGDGGFAFSAPAAYTPDKTLALKLSGVSGFKGILLYAIDDSAIQVGEWQSPFPGYQIKTGCTGDAFATLTQADATLKPVPASFTWKAPPALTGTVTLEALVMTSFGTYFNVSGLQIAEAIFLDGFE